jgi:hypothetical protein
MQTLIIPPPDSVSEIDDPCFNQFASGKKRSDCRSVALCVADDVSDDCNCGSSRTLGVLNRKHSGSAVMCADGYAWDPATGVCVREGSNGSFQFQPGILPSPRVGQVLGLPPISGDPIRFQDTLRRFGMKPALALRQQGPRIGLPNIWKQLDNRRTSSGLPK